MYWKCSSSLENTLIMKLLSNGSPQGLVGMTRKYIVYLLLSCSSEGKTFKCVEDFAKEFNLPEQQAKFVWNVCCDNDILRQKDDTYSAVDWMFEQSLLSNEDMAGMRMLKNAADAKSSEYPNQFNPNDVKQYVRPGVRLSQSDIEELRKSFTDEQITKMLDHLSDWKRRKGATFTNDFKAINDWVINWLKYHEERERKGNTLNQYRPQQQTRYSIPQTSNGASDGILPDWITEE